MCAEVEYGEWRSLLCILLSSIILVLRTEYIMCVVQSIALLRMKGYSATVHVQVKYDISTSTVVVLYEIPVAQKRARCTFVPGTSTLKHELNVCKYAYYSVLCSTVR